MSEANERTRNLCRTKTVCWFLAAFAVAVALVGYAISTPARRIVAVTALVVVSSILIISLCALLLRLYRKRADQAGVTLRSLILHGLMLHALSVAIAALVYATRHEIICAVAVADATLAALMVLLLSGVRSNWNEAAPEWVWVALPVGIVVFALRFFGIDWAVWGMIAVLAVAVVVAAACKPRSCSNWCNPFFALAVAILAVVLLLDGHAPQTQTILHALCLILTPIYALATFLLNEPNQARASDASKSCCLHNGQTVIYNHTAAEAGEVSETDSIDADDEDPDSLFSSVEERMQALESDGFETADDPQAEQDPKLTAIRRKMVVWRAEEESESATETHANEESGSPSEPATRARELNCDIALNRPYRALSLRYLSMAPLEAFSEITKAQIACMKSLGAHTVLDLATLPAWRAAQQIEWMASLEEKEEAGN